MNDSLRWLFVLLAPVTVPLYLLYLALMSIVAGCHALVIEQTLETLLRRPVALQGMTFWLLTPLTILLTPPVVLVHVALWLIRTIAGAAVALGRWQSGLRSKWITAPLGLMWALFFVWCVVTCVDATGGYWLTGRGIPGAADYDLAIRKRWTVGELCRRSPEAARHRTELVESLRNGAESRSRHAAGAVDDLQRDDNIFTWFPRWVRMRVAGVPWFFNSGLDNREATDHCEFLIGPLLLGLILLIRWPGTHPDRMPRALCFALFLARTGVTFWAMLYTLHWAPALLEPESIEAIAASSGFAPLSWLGADRLAWADPQWYTMNAALWLILLGILAVLWRAAAALRPWIGAPGYYSTFLAIRLLQRKRIAFFSIGAVTLCVAMELIVISVMGGFLDTIVSRARGLMGDLVMDAGMTGFPFYDEFIREARERLIDPRTKKPWIVAATPVIHSYGILRFPETGRVKEVQVRGVRLNEYCAVNDFGKSDVLYYNTHYPGTTRFAPAGQPESGADPSTGLPQLPEEFERGWSAYLASLSPERRVVTTERWERLRDDLFRGPGVFRPGENYKPGWNGRELPGIIIGRDLMFRRTSSTEYDRPTTYPRGIVCQVSLLPVTRRGQVSSEPPPAPLFRYVDDSRTGVFEIDSRTIYVDFEQLQDIVTMSPQKRADGGGMTPARCTSIQFKLVDGVNKHELRRDMELLWDDFRLRQDADADDLSALSNVIVATSDELQQDFIAAIQKEKVLVVIMFGIISVVAVLLVLCIFYMIVVEKTRDVGIIKSVGGSSQGVAAIFLTYGATIGIVGAALGTLIGRTFVKYINEVQDWLARLNPNWRIWSPETYSFDRIPSTVKTDEMLWIAGLAITASILGAAIPAIRAARTWPVEALRYE